MEQLLIDLVERSMVMEREETVLIVAKSVGLSWQTAKALLQLCAGKVAIPVDRIEYARTIYNNMKPETAGQVLKFQREHR